MTAERLLKVHVCMCYKHRNGVLRRLKQTQKKKTPLQSSESLYLLVCRKTMSVNVSKLKADAALQNCVLITDAII